jgi:hypothetical protein
MRNSWRQFFRRVATVTLTCGSLAWSSALCYAAQLAFDSADDPVYADGWQGRVVDAAGVAVVPSGDNGGFGFTPWNFTSLLTFGGMRYDYAHTDFHAVDDGMRSGTHYSNPFNGIGRAWVIGSAGTQDNGVIRASRGFAPLQTGQTLKIVIDNPTERQFFKGYFVRLHGGTGGMDGNLCYGGQPCVEGTNPTTKMVFSRFEYANDGEWTVEDASSTDTGVFDTDTAAAGAVFSVTRTGDETYDVLLDPLGPGPSYMASQTFDNAGPPVDWIEFTFFNPATDLATPPTLATDFYIRSMEIFDTAPAGVPGDYNDNGSVDAADYVLWRNGGPLQNEVAGVTPSQVTAEDYAAWRARFGNTSAVAAGSQLQVASVPEPGTFVYAIGIVAAGLHFCGSFRSRAQSIE